ncbi:MULTISPECIES: hypothetical protein [Geobacter]|uniref:hypothetical protein n=1 Tax=Geobacter TaxID=28231 RepID=UPI00257358AF|nr:hypothetical protein [Geobacter sulfurreducens]BEH10980.1 hypothetical protein GSUET_25920 [Geobacter sulfurreducens subsp. ethanolicus]BET58824.1 hypothetical protein GEO60473_18640 [Geobacter sp. 60473]
MKAAVLSLIILLAASASALAQPLQVVLATTATALTGSVIKPAPTEFYGLEVVLQLPVGITPKLDPLTPGKYFLDPATVVMVDNSMLNTGTLVSSALTPSTDPSVGDTVKFLLVNPYGVKFGTFGSLWFDFKPGFVPNYNATTQNVSNADIKVLSYRVLDVSGTEISTDQAAASISKTFVWKQP